MKTNPEKELRPLHTDQVRGDYNMNYHDITVSPTKCIRVARATENIAKELVHWHNIGPELLQALKATVDIIAERDFDHHCMHSSSAYQETYWLKSLRELILRAEK